MPLPAALCPPFSGEQQADAMVTAAHTMLAQKVVEPFVLTLLNIGESSIGQRPLITLLLIMHLQQGLRIKRLD